MYIIVLPNDIIYCIIRYLSIWDKIAMRETCTELNNNISFMEIRIGKMDYIIANLLNSRMYILSRLRLAALCGLHEHTVANIWSWATLIDDVKTDALPILRQLGRAIYQKSIISN